MYRFILKRLLMLIPVLLGVSFIVYTILSFTPGDPVQMMLGDNYSEESYAAMQEELGLDDPFLVQYGRFIINAVTSVPHTAPATRWRRRSPPGCPIPSCCRPAPCFLPF